MATRQEKIDKNRAYAWKQIENWLKIKYNANILIDGVFEDRYLSRERKYAKTVIETDPQTGQRVIKVMMDSKLLESGNKEKILHAACREAVRIGVISNGHPASDTSPIFRNELKKHALPDYGGFPEDGAELFVYSCAECNNIYAIRAKRFPKRNSPAMNKNVTSGCCGAIIRESDTKKHFTNFEVQGICNKIGLDLEQFAVLNKTDWD